MKEDNLRDMAGKKTVPKLQLIPNQLRKKVVQDHNEHLAFEDKDKDKLGNSSYDSSVSRGNPQPHNFEKINIIDKPENFPAAGSQGCYHALSTWRVFFLLSFFRLGRFSDSHPCFYQEPSRPASITEIDKTIKPLLVL